MAPVSRRRQLEVTCVADLLPEPPVADSVCFLIVRCKADVKELDVSILAPVRKTLRNHCVADVLLPVPCVDASNYFIRCDAEEAVVRRVLREPYSAESLPIVPAIGFEQHLAMRVDVDVS